MDAGREPDASRELLVVILVGTTEEVCGTKDGREHSSSINSFTLLASKLFLHGRTWTVSGRDSTPLPQRCDGP